jgi:outer membrane immunogenic protein
MSRIALAAAALIAAGCTASVRAADLPYGSRYPSYNNAVPLYDSSSWAGPYLGGNLGWAWGSVDNSVTKPSGFAGGVQAGFNWQPLGNQLVFGVEGDLQATGASDTFAPWKFSNPWFGTVRGRAGYSFGSILLYATAGLAFGELRGDTLGLSESHTNAGWTAGLGAEFRFNPYWNHWSAKVEYLFIDLNDSNFTITGFQNGYHFGLVRAGVNYRF